MSIEINLKALVSHIINGDGLHRCLICMNETFNGFVLIHDTITYEEDGPVSFAEAFQALTNIVTPEDDLMPQRVCVSCTEQLISAYNFRSSVKNCMNQWNDTFSVLEQLSYREPREAKSICAIITMNSDLTQFEEQTPKTQIKQKIKTKRKIVRQKSKYDRLGPKCSCPDCKHEFDSPHSLSKHFRFSSLKTVCLICGLVFPKGSEFAKHLSEAHNESKYLCSICPLTFGSQENLDKHLRSGHKPGLCYDCGKLFKKKESLIVHSQVHNIRTCQSCGSQFTNRACYRVHKINCSNEDEILTSTTSKLEVPIYICDYCNKEYKCKANLRNHIVWIHLKIKKFECQYCFKKCNTSAALTEHLLVHTKEKKFTCDICGIKIISKNALVYHRRLHTGEKPYPCPDCDQAFLSASRRSDHMKRKHKKGPMFNCPQCSLNYARSFELKKHLQKNHNFEADAVYLKQCFDVTSNTKPV